MITQVKLFVCLISLLIFSHLAAIDTEAPVQIYDIERQRDILLFLIQPLWDLGRQENAFSVPW